MRIVPRSDLGLDDLLTHFLWNTSGQILCQNYLYSHSKAFQQRLCIYLGESNVENIELGYKPPSGHNSCRLRGEDQHQGQRCSTVAVSGRGPENTHSTTQATRLRVGLLIKTSIASKYANVCNVYINSSWL